MADGVEKSLVGKMERTRVEGDEEERQLTVERRLPPLPLGFDPSRMVRRSLKLPQPTDAGKLAFVIENVLTKEECSALIAATEGEGYEHALVNMGGGRQAYRPDVRNSFRCIST